MDNVMNAIHIKDSRIMNSNITLKEALNRQFVALATYMPLDNGVFECKRDGRVGGEKPSVSFKSFERAYPLFRDTSSAPVEVR